MSESSSSSPPDSAQENAGECDYLNPAFLRLVEELWSQIPRAADEDAAADEPPTTSVEPDLESGAAITIGRFQIVRELGRGGSGIVLLAVDPSLRRNIALKVPAPDAILSTGSRQRFLREARAAAVLRHPNIVTVHETGEAGPIPYIVMDYCERGSLAGWLASRPAEAVVEPRWAASLVARIADGVQYAHDRGVIHRDLKPSNILFQSIDANDSERAELDEGTEIGGAPNVAPLVTDFGLAKRLDADHGALDSTVQGVPLGTIPYMASEAARGDRGAIGFATDVYGLGVILFELLTGRRPFAAPSRVELLEQVLNTEPPSPSTFRADLPRELERICLKCLRKRPSDRYQKPSEVANDLRAFIDGSPRSERIAKSRRTVNAPSRFVRYASIVALILIVAASLAAVGLWRHAEISRRDARDRLRQFELADLATLPSLLNTIDSREKATLELLARMSAQGTANQKIAAALALAKDGNSHAEYCYDQILTAAPDRIVPLARALDQRLSDFRSRLQKIVANAAETDDEPDARDHRRANAACALIDVGQGDEGWSLLHFAPNPQARSELIHLLGPAGVPPRRLVDRLIEERDLTIRRALIQSLGSVPDANWRPEVRELARSRVLELYERDHDSGVHGSAKWLLLRWKLDRALREVDERLARAGDQPGRQWRISPAGITLVKIHDRLSPRVIEVGDTEVTLALFLEFRDDHPYQTAFSPGPSYPASSITYVLAARFCNWLSKREGIPVAELAYRLGTDESVEPAENHADRAGYRLLGSEEFERACRAGANTKYYHGSSANLLHEYAWCGQPRDPGLHVGAQRKPNDYGLFDMLGNADDLCQASRSAAGSSIEAAVCGGSILYQESSIGCSLRRGPLPLSLTDPTCWPFGFRVARTISAR